MNLELKNKKLLRVSSLTVISLLATILAFFFIKGSVWCEYDYKSLDLFYKRAVKTGFGPKQSTFPQIKYVTITDETYSSMGKNFVDRSYLSRLNNSLNELGAEAIAYDIIFPHPTTPEADQLFIQSLSEIDLIYLPIGLDLAASEKKFKWGSDKVYDILKNKYLKKPVETGSPDPFYGAWALMQYVEFASKTDKSGHISAYTDSDGYARHMVMLVKVEDRYLPALSLSMFLDYSGVPFEKVIVDWGKQITIPVLKDTLLEKDVVIPIDKKGRAFIPFCQTWEKDFDEMPAHVLLEKIKNKNLQGNLAEIFEGNFIFIGDISIGISDAGNIPLQNNIPLIMTHTSMLNGMLTNTFYKKCSSAHIILFILFIGFLIWISALQRNTWILYLTGLGIFFGIVYFTWLQFIKFYLFPIATVTGSFMFLVSGLIISIQIVTSKDRTYIKNIFARYVPEKIVNKLLLNPELIKLGGETREISLMMSDLRGFTALSSHRSPREVIFILNRYLDKMIDIIMDFYGAIDEIIGDGILAFFGAPETMEDHPIQAVACALSMQKAMKEINDQNKADGLPALHMGIAVNTGEVVVGNIGSEKRTKYGAVGAEVNFTGRAESFTVGGQVLITEATYNKLVKTVHVRNVMEVEMKGMTGKVKLYDITGIGEPFNIYLENKEETLIEVKDLIDIKAYRLDDKIVQKDGVPARITHLCTSKAIIIISERLADLENIRFRILDRQSGTTKGEVYAKVISIRENDNDYNADIFFTSVDAEADQIFRKILSL